MAKVVGGERIVVALKELAAKVSGPRAVRVGFFEGATYPDGTSVPMVAAIQNFGAPAVGIPPRPFFSNVIAKGKRQWSEQVRRLLKDNNYDVDRTLMLMGEGIKGQLQNEINNGSFTPLAESTVRRKGFDKPLIDTKNMIDSVDYEVK